MNLSVWTLAVDEASGSSGDLLWLRCGVVFITGEEKISCSDS